MQQKTDTRLARAKAKTPRNLAAARHRSLLRARAALSALLREGLATPADGQALAGVLQLGAAAAAELARLPDTPDLRDSDLALLAHDHPWAEETFEVRLKRLMQQFPEGRELDRANVSPAELLAVYVARAALPRPLLPPHPQANDRPGQ
jgi:hypothetical protein